MTLLLPLFLVPALLCLALFFWFRSSALADDWARVIARRVLDYLRPASALSGPHYALAGLALVFAALSSPAIRADASNASALAEGVIVMADVSKSMALTDVLPRRIYAARAAALQVSANAGARPAALIAYAGDAYLLQPFAVDRRQFGDFASELDIGLIPNQGSNLERALALASTVIDESRVSRAHIVILTDGGGVSDDTTFIARRMAGKGHRLDVVAFADPSTAAPVAADFAAMQRLADAGGGALLPASREGQIDIAALDLDGGLFERGATTQLALRSTEWRNLSHFVLLLAAPLLLLAFRQVRQ